MRSMRDILNGCKNKLDISLIKRIILIINMTSETPSMWKRYQFCGGYIYGTQCSIDEETQIVTCTCSKNTLKGYDWTIVYYFLQMVSNDKVHLVDRYTKDKNNRSQDQVWVDLAARFNKDMKFDKTDDKKTGKELKDLLVTIQSKILISVCYHNIY